MRTYKAISWMLIAVSVLALVGSATLSYEECIRLISRITGYAKTEKITGLLTASKFQMLRLLPLAGIALASLMLVFHKPLFGSLQTSWNWARQIFAWPLKQAAGYERPERAVLWAILLVNVAVKGTLAVAFPVTYDEAFTYISFTCRGLISSLTYYPGPNNHILHSILTNISSLLPLPATLALRIPSLMVGTAFVFVFYVLLRRILSEKAALLAVLIASFLPPVIYYSFAARGYSLLLLCFTVCYFATIQLLASKENEARNLFCFSLFSVLGFYAIPSFLYPYVTLNLFLLASALIAKRALLVKRAIVSGVLTMATVVTLYLPVILISGPGALTSNKFVVPIGRAKVLEGLLPHHFQTFIDLFYFRHAAVLVYGAVIAACFMSKRRQVAWLNLWTLAFALAIPVLHGVIPFTRTWFYFVVPVTVSVGLVLEPLLSRQVKRAYVHAAAALATLVMIGGSYKRVQEAEDHAIAAEPAVDFLLSQNLSSIYVQEPLMDAYVIYAHKIRGRQLDCYVSPSDLVARRNSIQMLLYAVGSPPPKASNPVFANRYYNIYKNSNAVR